MRLVWKATAHFDRNAIYDYIESDSPQSAYELDLLISEKANLLLTSPKMGRMGLVNGTRELVIHPNYILIYRIMEKDKIVEILRVKHVAQDRSKF